MGKPVIGARIGGIKELIESEKTGMLFEGGNVENLADKINYFLNNRQHTIEMGKYARTVFKKINENNHMNR